MGNKFKIGDRVVCTKEFAIGSSCSGEPVVGEEYTITVDQMGGSMQYIGFLLPGYIWRGATSTEQGIRDGTIANWGADWFELAESNKRPASQCTNKDPVTREHTHTWQFYQGLGAPYEFCTDPKCDKKRPIT